MPAETKNEVQTTEEEAAAAEPAPQQIDTSSLTVPIEAAPIDAIAPNEAIDPIDIEGKSTHEILADVDIFNGLPLVHLRRVVDIGTQEQYKRNARIFQEDDAGDKFYLILDGAVRISRFVPGMGEEALAVLRAGAYFGEMSLIDEAPRSAAAIAHESTRLFVIDRRDLEDLLFVDRDLAYELLWNLVRTLSRRLRATNDKMTFLATTNKF